MKPVRVMPKFKCDFCKRRSTKRAMEEHEKICYRNPNRFCNNCENKGYTEEDHGIDEYSNWIKTPCYFCSKFDPKMLEEIKARESKI